MTLCCSRVRHRCCEQRKVKRRSQHRNRRCVHTRHVLGSVGLLAFAPWPARMPFAPFDCSTRPSGDAICMMSAGHCSMSLVCRHGAHGAIAEVASTIVLAIAWPVEQYFGNVWVAPPNHVPAILATTFLERNTGQRTIVTYSCVCATWIHAFVLHVCFSAERLTTRCCIPGAAPRIALKTELLCIVGNGKYVA